MSPDAFLSMRRAQIVVFIDRLVHDPDVAEDLAQDTLMRAWRHWDTFRGVDAARLAWLYAIARNLTYDWFRNIRRRESSLDDPLGVGPKIKASNDTAEAALNRVDADLALSRMKPRDRAIFAGLAEGYESAEIGDAIGMTGVGVRARIHRARLAAVA